MIVQYVVEILKDLPALAGPVGDRIYPVSWPDAPEFPLVLVQKPGGIPEADMQGSAGIESDRVQVDVYGDRGYAEVVALASAIKKRLHATSVGPASAPCAIDSSFCINDADLPVPATERAGPRLRRRMLEFRIWTKEA